jgi:hypothetical protein
LSYEDAREILNLAADSLAVERARLDYSIWKYVSQRKKERQGQTPRVRQRDADAKPAARGDPTSAHGEAAR